MIPLFLGPLVSVDTIWRHNADELSLGHVSFEGLRKSNRNTRVVLPRAFVAVVFASETGSLVVHR